MAHCRKFAGMTAVLEGPPGTEEDIVPLPVCRAKGTTISCWELSEIEKQVIAETGVVWLAVAGTPEQGHPIVLISGVPMMEQRDPDGCLEPYDIEARAPGVITSNTSAPTSLQNNS